MLRFVFAAPPAVGGAKMLSTSTWLSVVRVRLHGSRWSSSHSLSHNCNSSSNSMATTRRPVAAAVSYALQRPLTIGGRATGGVRLFATASSSSTNRSGGAGPQSQFDTSRVVDFQSSLQAGAKALNDNTAQPVLSPSEVWTATKHNCTGHSEFLPFYLFDVSVDMYFRDATGGPEYVFRDLRFSPQTHGNDALVYGAYKYRRAYAQAIKDIPWERLADAPTLKQALNSSNFARAAGGVRNVEFGAFGMHQEFAWSMLSERLLRFGVAAANEYLANNRLSQVPSARVRMELKRSLCIPFYLPAHVFEYRYLGLPYRALVSGYSLTVGGETHRQPLAVAGATLTSLVAMTQHFYTEFLLIAAAVAVVDAVLPSVKHFVRGAWRRVEETKEAMSRSKTTDWKAWETSGHWGQWYSQGWEEREREHREREHFEAQRERETARERASSSWAGTRKTAGKQETAEDLQFSERASHYTVLGITDRRAATTTDIQAAFRKLAMLYHPDVVKDKSAAAQAQANARFRRIMEAYQVLRNPSKRSTYDATLK